LAETVFAAVPTPFTTAGDLDLAAARRLFTLAAAHLDGLFVAGTTGEFASLDDGERLALIELGLEIAGPDRVIAHIGAPDARRAARLAGAAAARGATRVAAVTPYYNTPRRAELTDYYVRVRDTVPAADNGDCPAGTLLRPCLGRRPGGRETVRVRRGRRGRVRGGVPRPAGLLRGGL
jgi:4-hydroxy-tetrahydrodipicolinate synthase